MTTDSGAGRRLLIGRRPVQRRPVRPPWAVAEELFTDICNRCMACAEICPQEILIQGAGGYPEADFTERGCTFCGDCVTACKPAALVRPAAETSQRAWPHRASIQGGCITNAGSLCRTCLDACRHNAIRVVPREGGGASPEVSAADCTGCGSCSAACPVKAITLTPSPN